MAGVVVPRWQFNFEGRMNPDYYRLLDQSRSLASKATLDFSEGTPAHRWPWSYTSPPRPLWSRFKGTASPKVLREFLTTSITKPPQALQFGVILRFLRRLSDVDTQRLAAGWAISDALQSGAFIGAPQWRPELPLKGASASEVQNRLVRILPRLADRLPQSLQTCES